MRIAVWKTGHIIADTVADAVMKGLPNARIYYTNQIESIKRHERGDNACNCIICDSDVHIAYGILRGTSQLFRICDSLKKPWFNIDRGYFKPSHYDGYYRVSLCGTQQTQFLEQLEPNYDRLSEIGITYAKGWHNPDGHTLVVPPTQYVANFYGIDATEWLGMFLAYNPQVNNIIIRNKGDSTPLDENLKNCRQVVTFNSSVGWEALRRGIPVYSDPTHSIVGAYQKLVDKPQHMDFNERRKLFGIMGDLELTLNEIREGLIWPLLEKLLSLRK